MDDVDETSAAAADAAETSSGVISAPEGSDDDRAGNALHERLPLQTSPAGGDEDEEQPPAGASSEHQDDGGPGTGCQPSSAAGDASHDPATAPAAPSTADMTERQRAVLDAIIALQDAGERATTAMIGVRSGVKQSGVSWYIRWLEEHGWLRREGTAGDRCYTIFHRPDGATPPRPPSTPGPAPGTRGAAWSEQEDRTLREMWHAGDSSHAIAQRTERNVKSVYKRAEHLGLPSRKVGATRRMYQQPVKSQKQREAENKGLCAACQTEPAAEGSDLCDGCNAKARALPGVGEGPLPHYDERKRQEAAEDTRQRHRKRQAETSS